MRHVVITLLIVVAAIAFATARTTTSGESATPDSTERELTGRIGDSILVPSIGLYCSVEIEARRPRFLCGRLGQRPRYQVSFEKLRTVVITVGAPGRRTVFLERR
jgi:hypothetical protein